MGVARVEAALVELDVALAELAVPGLDRQDRLGLLDGLERLARQLPAHAQRILASVVAECEPAELGARSWRQVLVARLRISRAEAGRRLGDAEQLAPRTGLTGQPLAPVLAVTAAAQAEGAIGAEHVRVIRSTMDALPGWVDVVTREQAEADLVAAARGLDPDLLKKAAERLLALLDQDGPAPDDAERARRRGLWIGAQRRDGMTPIRGLLDPEARATWEPILAKLAAPGMANPADAEPCTKGTPSTEQIQSDGRNLGQRQHDAFVAVGRSALASGELGQHHGLPVSVIVSTTLQELQSAAGVAVTGGGSLLPMREVIRLASHANHYLAVFDAHTREALYLGRSKRIASAGQRIVLHTRDRGCTKPGCPVSGYASQVHHTRGWAKAHGRTDIDALTLACGADNRLAEEGWTVSVVEGVAHWTPPPGLDTGQTRINAYHHPERILKPPDEEPEQPPEHRSGGGSAGGQPAAGPPGTESDPDPPGDVDTA
jgi:hypothetical protein